jgi:hypothetical protein
VVGLIRPVAGKDESMSDEEPREDDRNEELPESPAPDPEERDEPRPEDAPTAD